MERKPYTARAYQGLITGHITDVPRCAVWAGMGLGKTISTLTGLDNLFLGGEDAPALVLAPLRVAKNTWPNEARKWQHLRHIDIMPIVGSEAERRLALKYDVSVFTCNYDNLQWLVEHWGDRWPYRTVISDEATRLKGLRLSFRTSSTGKQFVAGQGGKRARALGKISHTKIKRFIQLTGTPSPNGLKDLWGQMWFLDGGQRLGRTYDSFKQRWFQKSFDGYSVDPLPMAQEQIQDRLRDICMTIDAKDWFDLKAPIVNNIYVDLPVKARNAYREMERQMFTEIADNPIEAFNAAARTQKCLQLANGAAYIGSPDDPGERKWVETHDTKLAALESIVEEANGMPVLCSYEFKSDRARILRTFPKAVDLSTDEGMKTFMKGKSPLGLAHPASLGHGVDGLQDVSNIIAFFGHNWNLELYQQIIERIGPVRQLQSGYERPVFIHHIIARDTVDELVMARRESKREVQDLLLEAMKARR